MKVLFNSVKEFLDELERDPPPDRIVRTTRLRQQSGAQPFVSAFALATFVNRLGQVVELRKYVGEDWGPDFECSQKAKDLADRILTDVEQAARRHEMEIRAGQLVDE